MSSVSRRGYDVESMKSRRGEYEAKRRRLQREEEPDEKQRLIDEEKEVMRHLRELLRIEEQERRQLEREEMRLVRELERTRLCQEEECWRKKMKRPEQQRQESGHQARPDCSSKPSSSRAGSSQLTRERAIEQLQKDVIAINNQEPDVMLPNYSEQQVGMLEAIPTDQRPPITVNCKLFGSIRLFPFEAQKLPQLIHNNVMSSIGFLSSQGDYLMLEKPRGESLVEYLSNKTISVSMLLIWILDIARGLHYLHSRNLAHGALYQRNVFTHGDRLKLESPLILNRWKKNNFASLWDTTLDLFAFALLIDQLVPHAKMASSEDRKDVECMKKHSRDVQRNIQSNVVFRAAMAERSGRIDENTAYQELISRFKLLPTGSSSRESLYTIEYIVSFLEDKVPDE